MDKSLGRYVALAYIAAAMLLAFILSRALHTGLFYAGVEDYPILGNEYPLSSLVGVVLSAVTAVVCFRHPAVRTPADEVASELAKVSWPSRKETWAATIVVIVTVAVSSVYLGVFDAVWHWASNAILSIPNGTATTNG